MVKMTIFDVVFNNERFSFGFLVVRELPILSLANPGMEHLVDTSTTEYTSMLLNCRDGALAQQLAHKLSLVSNTTTSMWVEKKRKSFNWKSIFLFFSSEIFEIQRQNRCTIFHHCYIRQHNTIPIYFLLIRIFVIQLQIILDLFRQSKFFFFCFNEIFLLNFQIPLK